MDSYPKDLTVVMKLINNYITGISNNFNFRKKQGKE